MNLRKAKKIFGGLTFEEWSLPKAERDELWRMRSRMVRPRAIRRRAAEVGSHFLDALRNLASMTDESGERLFQEER